LAENGAALEEVEEPEEPKSDSSQSPHIRPLVRLLVARMESNPEEFLQVTGQFHWGRWGAIHGRCHHYFNKPEKNSLAKATGDLMMQRGHEDYVKELMKEPEKPKEDKAKAPRGFVTAPSSPYNNAISASPYPTQPTHYRELLKQLQRQNAPIDVQRKVVEHLVKAQELEMQKSIEAQKNQAYQNSPGMGLYHNPMNPKKVYPNEQV